MKAFIVLALLVAVTYAATTPPNPPPTVTIMCVESGFLLDGDNDTFSYLSTYFHPFLAPADNSITQKWGFHHISGNDYYVRSYNGLFLDQYVNPNNNIITPFMNHFTGSSSQTWTFTPAIGDYFIRSISYPDRLLNGNTDLITQEDYSHAAPFLSGYRNPVGYQWWRLSAVLPV